MNLEFGKWIYPSPSFPTFQTLEFDLTLENPHGSGAVHPLPAHPVHTGLTYPVRTDHPVTSAFFFSTPFFSNPTLVFFRIFSRGFLIFGLRFLLCPKVFWLFRHFWTSSSPPL